MPLTRAASGFISSDEIVVVEPEYFTEPPVNETTPLPDVLPQSIETRSSSLPFNDPYLGAQWHYRNLGSASGYGYVAGADINLFNAWTKTVGHPNVIVAVVDGGIQYDHPDLAENIWVNTGEIPNNGIDDDRNGYIDDYYGFNFYNNIGTIIPNDHGTHVAGTIGAVNNNGIGVCGIAGGDKVTNRKGVRLMSCQIFHPDHTGGTSDARLAEAIKYGADNGAVISQNSWGYTNPNVFPSVIKAAIDYFIANAGINNNGVQTGPMKGGVVLVAAGNDGNSSTYYPAAYSNVIAVASINANGQKASSSNYGSWINLSAPGGTGIYSTVTKGGYGSSTGTSMACPHVSGVAALVLSAALENPKSVAMTPTILKDILYSVKGSLLHSYNPANYHGLLGEGLTDANSAVNQVALPTTEPIISGPDSFPEGDWRRFSIVWPEVFKQEYLNGYTIRWLDTPFVTFNVSESAKYIEASCCAPEESPLVDVSIQGKYNGYYQGLMKYFYVTEKPDTPRLIVTTYIDGGHIIPLSLTISVAGIEKVKKAYIEGGPHQFSFHLPNYGLNRLTVRCTDVGFHDDVINRSFNVYIDKNGGELEIEFKEYSHDIKGILYNTSPDYSKSFYWCSGRNFPY